MTYDLSNSNETAIVVKAYRTFVKQGYSHTASVKKIRTEVIPQFSPKLNKGAGLQIADSLEKESHLQKWWK